MKKMGQGIKLPDEIKEKARVLLTEGYSVNYISKVLKISRNSVNKARDEKDNLDSLRQDKKRKMAESLWDLAIQAKEKITEGKLKDSSAAKLVIVLATLIDKALLLVGDVTERVGLSMPEIDQRLLDIQEQRKILKQAQGVISRKGKQLQKDRADDKS